MIILKVTHNRGITLFLEDAFFEKPYGGDLKFLQAVAPMQIPHFRKLFYPSASFSFPVPCFRENKG